MHLLPFAAFCGSRAVQLFPSEASAISPANFCQPGPRTRLFLARAGDRSGPERFAFHAVIQPRYLLGIAVEQQCRTALIRPDQLLARLAPARMRHLRVHVCPEPVLRGLQGLPETLRPLVAEGEAGDRLDRLEPVLPGHCEAQRRAMLLRHRMP